jgi:hypothetical protein
VFSRAHKFCIAAGVYTFICFSPRISTLSWLFCIFVLHFPYFSSCIDSKIFIDALRAIQGAGRSAFFVSPLFIVSYFSCLVDIISNTLFDLFGELISITDVQRD